MSAATARNAPLSYFRQGAKPQSYYLAFFATLRLGGKYSYGFERLAKGYASGTGLWQTLQNFSFVPVVIGSGQGFAAFDDFRPTGTWRRCGGSC